ncbi:MAG: ankyrin repeat domain-containing protein [Sedimentisphaerales bacterium]
MGTDINERTISGDTALHYAIKYQHRDVAELLIAAGADINIQNRDGETPAHLAIKAGQKEVLDQLIAKGAIVSPVHLAAYTGDLAAVRECVEGKTTTNAMDEGDLTLLHAAASGGQTEVADYLIRKGSQVNVYDKKKQTPLFCAASLGHKDIVELLITKGAVLNPQREPDCWTPLYTAVDAGHKDVVELLADAGGNVNVRAITGDTPLHSAARAGHKAIIELLIAKGADVNVKNVAGQTPSDLALARNRPAIAKLLIEKGAIVSNIHTASFAGDLKKVRGFVKAGADVNSRDETSMTPLLRAVSGRHADIAKFLIEKGADVNIGDKRGYVPLVYALWNTDPNVVKMLLDNGADVNAKDIAMGYTALHWAVLMENKESTQLILTAGADVSATSNSGETPLDVAAYGVSPAIGELLTANGAEISSLHAAAYMGDLAKVKSFIDKGSDVNEKKGMIQISPLHSAAAGGRTEVAELLISIGADVNAQNSLGQTPLHIAARKGHLEVVQLLMKSGGDVLAKDRRDRTPIDLAREAKHTEIVRLLDEVTLIHDVAVTEVSAPTTCVHGTTIPVAAILENRGDIHETPNVRLLDTANRGEIACQSVTVRSRHKAASEADLTFTGEIEDETEFGIWCNADGDVNGDGFNDLLITANHYPAKGVDQGRAYLYYGGPQMDKTPDKRFTGEERGDTFGDNAGFLVDMNNDGFDDIILGARYHDSRGRVYIFYGGTDMDEKYDIIIDPPTSDGTKLNFGRGGMHPGDFNGDGVMDLVCSAIGYGPYIGRVYLYYGPLASDTTVDKVFTGETPGGTFGPIIAVGDVNGDKCHDLLVATRYFPALDPPTFGRVGRAYLYYGAQGTSMDIDCDLIFDPPDKGKNEFGSSADVFDIDNDGFADVLIGARRYANDNSIGRVYIYWGKPSGFDNTVGMTITGEAPYSALGGDFINCRYTNDDKYGDILVTAYQYNREQSRAYLYHGGPRDLVDAVADHVFTPEIGRNGVFKSILADLNGDGHGDVVMSGCYYNNSQGRAWVWYGPFGSSSSKLTFHWDTANASIGKHTLKVEIPPLEGEQNTENNVKTVTIEVKEPRK